MISLTLYRSFISSISISIQFYICNNVFDNHLEEFHTRLKSSMEYLLINFLAKPDSNYCISSFEFKTHTIETLSVLVIKPPKIDFQFRMTSLKLL